MRLKISQKMFFVINPFINVETTLNLGQSLLKTTFYPEIIKVKLFLEYFIESRADCTIPYFKHNKDLWRNDIIYTLIWGSWLINELGLMYWIAYIMNQAAKPLLQNMDCKKFLLYHDAFIFKMTGTNQRENYHL